MTLYWPVTMRSSSVPSVFKRGWRLNQIYRRPSVSFVISKCIHFLEVICVFPKIHYQCVSYIRDRNKLLECGSCIINSCARHDVFKDSKKLGGTELGWPRLQNSSNEVLWKSKWFKRLKGDTNACAAPKCARARDVVTSERYIIFKSFITSVAFFFANQV